MRTFLDTNVLVYAVDDRDPEKQRIGQDVLAGNARDLALSSQVLGEFHVTVTRKLPRPLSAADARGLIADFVLLHVVSLDAALVTAALVTTERSTISYWDALIIEAAVAARCEQVFSEDLNDGQVIRGVRVVNPFAGPKR